MIARDPLDPVDPVDSVAKIVSVATVGLAILGLCGSRSGAAPAAGFPPVIPITCGLGLRECHAGSRPIVLA
jgi:hypothetical protein